jgi:predicted rRNA methylase YqxC with S4 and FtsJ domains
VIAVFARRGLLYKKHIDSPIVGSDGNVEFVTWFVRERP